MSAEDCTFCGTVGRIALYVIVCGLVLVGLTFCESAYSQAERIVPVVQQPKPNIVIIEMEWVRVKDGTDYLCMRSAQPEEGLWVVRCAQMDYMHELRKCVRGEAAVICE